MALCKYVLFALVVLCFTSAIAVQSSQRSRAFQLALSRDAAEQLFETADEASADIELEVAGEVAGEPVHGGLPLEARLRAAEEASAKIRAASYAKSAAEAEAASKAAAAAAVEKAATADAVKKAPSTRYTDQYREYVVADAKRAADAAKTAQANAVKAAKQASEFAAEAEAITEANKKADAKAAQLAADKAAQLAAAEAAKKAALEAAKKALADIAPDVDSATEDVKQAESALDVAVKNSAAARDAMDRGGKQSYKDLVKAALAAVAAEGKFRADVVEAKTDLFSAQVKRGVAQRAVDLLSPVVAKSKQPFKPAGFIIPAKPASRLTNVPMADKIIAETALSSAKSAMLQSQTLFDRRIVDMSWILSSDQLAQTQKDMLDDAVQLGKVINAWHDATMQLKIAEINLAASKRK